MTTYPVSAGQAAGFGPKYAVIPVHGFGIAVATAVRMLDPDDRGAARILPPGEQIPYGTSPILIAESTVYGLVCVEHMLRGWHVSLPRPWLVLVSDAPAAPVTAARYRMRALGSRLAGIARIPYLPSLRTVESADEALKYKDVQAAAVRLRSEIEGK
ncbi:hypothetical protein [Streptomyces sp. NPDC059757]|uniref:hypothetical protein n=1 Tax=Streptomyces sp. NPDC059757 TaxID=3346935 RepID=UPI003653258A